MKANRINKPGIPTIDACKSLGIIIGTAAALTGLTSCGTTSPKPQPAFNVALLDATPAKHHRDRIKGMTIMSVNGSPANREEASLPPGRNDVKVRFDWPQGGSQDVRLKFNARRGQRYFVKYDPFPSTADQFRGTTEMSNGAWALMGTAAKMDIAGLVLVPGVLTLGIADYGYRVKETIRENLEAAHYVDVFVISEDNAEGVVRRVRAFPDGRVDGKPWDAWSNAPAGSRNRGTSFRQWEQEEREPEMNRPN